MDRKNESRQLDTGLIFIMTGVWDGFCGHGNERSGSIKRREGGGFL
jgi:hypothetical protein